MNLEYFTVPEIKKKKKKRSGKDQERAKGQTSEGEEAPNGQSQGNFSSKINNNMIKYSLIVNMRICS